MTGMQQVFTLRHGQRVQVVSPIGETRLLKVMIGDALAHGETTQIWLIHEESGEYFRKLPNKENEVGKALFHTQNEVITCLENRAFYFA